MEEDLKEVTVSEYFAKSSKGKTVTKSPSKSAAKTKENAAPASSFDDVVSDDDDDLEMLDAEIARSSQVKTEDKSPAKAKATPKSSPAKPKATPKSKAKAKAEPEEPVKTAGAAGGAKSAKDVLAGIPDAVLPEVSGETPKFNFHAHKAKMEAAPQAAAPAEVPEAAPNCLAGMAFVFTGILPTLPRETGQDLVKRYGGKVTTAPSRNTTVVVLGDDAGPKKIQKIKGLGIKTIDEAGFIQLLSEMPADGGSGEAAQKAMEKKRREEEKAEAEAQRMAERMAAEEKAAAKAAAAKAAAASRPSAAATGSSRGTAKGKESAAAAEGPRVISEAEKLWTVRYAPKEMGDIVGNAGPVNRLKTWLTNWHRNQKAGFKGAGDASLRAAMLHGPPGIGKTTAAHLVAKSLGFDVIESNASDTRSKKLIQNNVAKTLDNSSLAGFLGGDERKKHTVLVLDEVDGMSAGDRGGVGAMAALCRSTNIPLILVCNERNLPKMRPFDRVTLDIPFRRPDANAIRPRIRAIAAREGIKLDEGVIEQLVQSSRSDIRQIINLLSTFATTGKVMNFDDSKALSKAWEKEIILKPFDIVGRLLSGATFAPNSGMSLQNKMELYFHDHDFAPLMVQENYLSTVPARAGSTPGGSLALAAKAAESISDGDLVDRTIHGSQQQWSLMPLHAVLSSVRPASFVAGQGRGRFNFTAYLGNNSKAGKYSRLLQEIQAHARLALWADKNELRQQYLPTMTSRLAEPLLQNGAAGVDEVMQFMDTYYLTKEDWEVIMELGVGRLSYEQRAKNLPTAVKSGFTRQYNAASHPVPYMRQDLSAPVAVKAERPDIEDVIEDDVEPEAADDDDAKSTEPDVTKDKYIKVAKPKATKKAAASKSTAAKKKGKAKA